MDHKVFPVTDAMFTKRIEKPKLLNFGRVPVKVKGQVTTSIEFRESSSEWGMEGTRKCFDASFLFLAHRAHLTIFNEKRKVMKSHNSLL